MDGWRGGGGRREEEGGELMGKQAEKGVIQGYVVKSMRSGDPKERSKWALKSDPVVLCFMKTPK